MAKKVVLFLVVMVAVMEVSHGLTVCGLNEQALRTCQPSVATYNPTSPSPGCCTAVKGLTVNDIQCFCNYKKNKPFLLWRLGVNPVRCIQLPRLCGFSVPVTNC